MLAAGVVVFVAVGLATYAFPEATAANEENPGPYATGSGSCCCVSTVSLRAGEKKAGAEALAKGVAARKATTEHKMALAKDGVFSCCIRPSCGFCAAAGDMCPCADMLAKGEAVCPECWGGWQAGVGRLPTRSINRPLRLRRREREAVEIKSAATAAAPFSDESGT